MTDKIDIQLVETNVYTRWPCTVCGGCTEKVSVLAEERGVPKGSGIRVCETCLKAGNIDDRLEQHAKDREQQARDCVAFAAELRGLKGRLVVPTYEAWQEAVRKHEGEYDEHTQLTGKEMWERLVAYRNTGSR
jgi:hypothetical protein